MQISSVLKDTFFWTFARMTSGVYACHNLYVYLLYGNGTDKTVLFLFYFKRYAVRKANKRPYAGLK